VQVTPVPKARREPFGPSAVGRGRFGSSGGDRKGGGNGQDIANSVACAIQAIVVIRSLACAAGAAASLAPVNEASAKMAQKAVEYQDTPKGDQQCSNCSLFQEPNACTLVDGEISPAGWCKFWVKKTG
jgi:hypothetical protein